LSSKGVIKSGIHSGLATALEVLVTTSQQASSLPEYPTIYFGYIPWGYTWCFPAENNKVLGICGLNHKAGKVLKNSFKQFLETSAMPADYISAAKSSTLPDGNFLTQPGYKRVLLNDSILSELRYARAGRQIIYSLPGPWPFRVISFLLRTIPQICEETIQGQRSFKWFRPIVQNNRDQNPIKKKYCTLL
jgi:hypothetical protein